MKNNAKEIYNNIIACMDELENANGINGRIVYKGYTGKKAFWVDAVCEELSIFDWWNETLSMSQLKQMKKFLERAMELGFNGFVCFKVGAKYCSHGMWANTNESADGYSPKDGDVLFHSFRSGENYFDACIGGEWMHKKYATEDNPCPDFTFRQVKNEVMQKGKTK